MTTLNDVRREFASRADCRFVSTDVFLACLTGRSRFVRDDEPEANLLGLRDEATGRRILIPAEKLQWVTPLAAGAN